VWVLAVSSTCILLVGAPLTSVPPLHMIRGGAVYSQVVKRAGLVSSGINNDIEEGCLAGPGLTAPASLDCSCLPRFHSFHVFRRYPIHTFHLGIPFLNILVTTLSAVSDCRAPRRLAESSLEFQSSSACYCRSFPRRLRLAGYRRLGRSYSRRVARRRRPFAVASDGSEYRPRVSVMHVTKLSEVGFYFLGALVSGF
jgi:hypothetical protein